MQRKKDCQRFNSSTKNVLMIARKLGGLSSFSREHKKIHQQVKKKKIISTALTSQVFVNGMCPFGTAGGFASLNPIIIDYLSTENCLKIIKSSNKTSHFPMAGTDQTITTTIILLADTLVKKRRIQDIKNVLHLLRPADGANISPDLINMDSLQINRMYIDLCKKHRSLWEFNIHIYMKSSLQILNDQQKISLQSLIAAYIDKNDVAKLFYQAVSHKKFTLLNILQQINSHEKLLQNKNFDANAHNALSLLGNIVNQLSLSIDKFCMKTQVLCRLLYRFPKVFLRNEIKLLEKHAVRPQYAIFMLLSAFEKSNGPPWAYNIAERELAFTVLSAIIKKAENVTDLLNIYEDHIDCAYFKKSLFVSGKFFHAKAYKYKLSFVAALHKRMFEIMELLLPIERQIIEERMILQHPIALYKVPLQTMLGDSHIKQPIQRQRPLSA